MYGLLRKKLAWLLAHAFHGGCPVSGLSMLFAGGVLFVWSSWRRLDWRLMDLSFMFGKGLSVVVSSVNYSVKATLSIRK